MDLQNIQKMVRSCFDTLHAHDVRLARTEPSTTIVWTYALLVQATGRAGAQT